MLRKAPKLYELIEWARGEAHLWHLVAEFDRLRANRYRSRNNLRFQK
jgi:hypothetical protein